MIAFFFLLATAGPPAPSPEVDELAYVGPAHARGVPLALHADWLRREWSALGCRFGETIHSHLAATAGPEALALVLTQPAPLNGFDFEAPERSAEGILRALPEWNVVYPSEMYFYYQFNDGLRRVAGNLRFVEARNGRISVGYFDRLDVRTSRSSELGESNGWKISLEEYPRGQVVRVSKGETTRHFFLPLAVAARCDAERLTDREQHVSGVLDESGIFLQMIWCDDIGQFAYVRCDTHGPTDWWVSHEVSGRKFEFGQRSRFVFYVEPRSGRRVLVGVAQDEVRANSYFDGPFDQVPPYLPLGERLNRSYPYLASAGGIDEHGTFLNDPGTRVAISTYQQYAGTASGLMRELADKVNLQASGQQSWASAVWETKRNFHKRQTRALHSKATSGSWPANHYGQLSRTWPANHAAETSRISPPNRPLATE